MSKLDLNLLVTLDVLLAESSVARAARRLRLSPSAMSRALARLRTTTGDPLLVRAGRSLVPTPRARELRERVGRLVAEGRSVLNPAEKPDIRRLERTFTIRARDGFLETFGAALISRAAEEAPRVMLRFVQKTNRDSSTLRDGIVDLELGVVDEEIAPEIRVQALFSDRFVGVVRKGHALSRGEVTLSRFAAGRHIHVGRGDGDRGLIDEALKPFGAERTVIAIVGGFSAALALVRGSDLIAAVPERFTQTLRAGMRSFDLPVTVPDITVSLLWHPRLDADPGHRWLRECVRRVCGKRPNR